MKDLQKIKVNLDALAKTYPEIKDEVDNLKKRLAEIEKRNQALKQKKKIVLQSETKRITRILNLVSDTGMILASFADELKIRSSTIRSWKSGRHSPTRPEIMLNAMKRRAKILTSADLEKNNLYHIRDTSGISFESISEEMDISRQALDQFVKENWESEAGKKRKKQCQEVLRAMGRRINSALK